MEIQKTTTAEHKCRRNVLRSIFVQKRFLDSRDALINNITQPKFSQKLKCFFKFNHNTHKSNSSLHDKNIGCNMVFIDGDHTGDSSYGGYSYLSEHKNTYTNDNQILHFSLKHESILKNASFPHCSLKDENVMQFFRRINPVSYGRSNFCKLKIHKPQTLPSELAMTLEKNCSDVFSSSRKICASEHLNNVDSDSKNTKNSLNISNSLDNNRSGKLKKSNNFSRTYSSNSTKVCNVEVGPSSFDKIKLLGKGDVGKVYLVREKKTRKLYAMKGEIFFHDKRLFLTI